MDSNGLILCGSANWGWTKDAKEKPALEGFGPSKPIIYRRGPIRRFKRRGLLNSTAPRDRRPPLLDPPLDARWRVSVPRNPLFTVARFDDSNDDVVKFDGAEGPSPSTASELAASWRQAAALGPKTFLRSQIVGRWHSSLSVCKVCGSGDYLPLPKSITWMVLSIVLQSKSREK
jgi:hypothetical protein